MNKSDILTLFDYNYWANARILGATAKVTHEQFIHQADLSHGSLRSTLVHALTAEFIWRMRSLEGISPTTLFVEQDFPSFDALRMRWGEEELAMRANLAQLTDDKLVQTVRYTTTKGVPFESVLWKLLAHLVNHGTQTRAEAGIALTAFGQSPGDLDMLVFFRELSH